MQLCKVFTAETAVAPYRIVKVGSGDGTVVQAAAATDALLGVSNNMGGEVGDRVDILLTGLAEVEYGDAVTAGVLLTADADGKAIPAAPATAANARVIGMAIQSGQDGEILNILLSPGQIQG